MPGVKVIEKTGGKYYNLVRPAEPAVRGTDMDFDKIQEIIAGLGLDEEIQTSDIPELELYMDQVLEFLNNRLKWLKRDPFDKGLTKTMVNNYTKDQLLIPPQNRKYGKQHIMLLTLICQLKSVLSINDIKRLFSPVLNDINTPDDDVIPLEEIYIKFLDLKRKQLAEFQAMFAAKSQDIKSNLADNETANQATAELFLIVLMLVAQASASKRLAEKLIDTFLARTE